MAFGRGLECTLQTPNFVSSALWEARTKQYLHTLLEQANAEAGELRSFAPRSKLRSWALLLQTPKAGPD